jgi:hypothetical protein
MPDCALKLQRTIYGRYYLLSLYTFLNSFFALFSLAKLSP